MLDQAFPQSTNLIVAVVDATTPEAADEAADALVNDLSPRSDVIRTIRRPDGGEFFARNGILFLSVDEVRRDTAELIKAQPALGTLAADPTLRGVLRTLSQSIEGVRRGKAELEDLRPAVVAIADALESLAKGKESRLLVAEIDHRSRAEAIRASTLREHPARPGLQRSRARRQGDGGGPGGDFEARSDAREGGQGAPHRIGRSFGRGIRYGRRRRGPERRHHRPRRHLRAMARAEAGPHHSRGPGQPRHRAHPDGRARAEDGGSAEPDLGRFRRAFHRARR